MNKRRALVQVIDERERAIIIIEGGTLVDSDGNRATVPLTATVHSYDLNLPNALPGDESAIDANGNDAVMVSFGAVSVDITDVAGDL